MWSLHNQPHIESDSFAYTAVLVCSVLRGLFEKSTRGSWPCNLLEGPNLHFCLSHSCSERDHHTRSLQPLRSGTRRLKRKKTTKKRLVGKNVWWHWEVEIPVTTGWTWTEYGWKFSLFLYDCVFTAFQSVQTFRIKHYLHLKWLLQLWKCFDSWSFSK